MFQVTPQLRQNGYLLQSLHATVLLLSVQMGQLGSLGRLGCDPSRSIPDLLPLRVSTSSMTLLVRLANNFLSCLSQRRRRKAGRKPYYGTGWVPAGNVGNQNSQYQAPPPQYGQQHDGAPQGRRLSLQKRKAEQETRRHEAGVAQV